MKTLSAAMELLHSYRRVDKQRDFNRRLSGVLARQKLVNLLRIAPPVFLSYHKGSSSSSSSSSSLQGLGNLMPEPASNFPSQCLFGLIFYPVGI